MKKALRKGSATSDEESVGGGHHHHQHHNNNNNNKNHGNEDENTDTEQHESLPHDQEDEDNKINIQKQSGAGEKKRDLFPELIKKLRESAKKNNTVIDVQPQKKAPSAPESTDDDERVVRERRKSLLRRGMKNGEPVEVVVAEAKFDVIDETSGGGGGKVAAEKPAKKSKVKASVFTFDVPQTPEVNSSSDNEAKVSSKAGGAKGEVSSPKSPIYATVNKARKSPTDPNDDSIKGKFNSFFTIVREAVHARRQSLIAEQLDSDVASIASSPVVRSPRPPPPPISKRDSDCSIWSDNIPVITISKTGSDECILEEDKKASSSSAPSSDGEQAQETSVTRDEVLQVVDYKDELTEPPKSI